MCLYALLGYTQKQVAFAFRIGRGEGARARKTLDLAKTLDPITERASTITERANFQPNPKKFAKISVKN